MGTSSLTCVISKKDVRVAQLGCYDGYPSGEGLKILGMIQPANMKKIKNNLHKCEWLSDDEYNKYKTEFGGIDENALEEAYPNLYWYPGSDLLLHIMSAKETILLRNNYVKTSDSLTVDWVYIIDIDKNTFEVYKGGNHTPIPQGERYYGMPPIQHSKNIYYPVKLVAEYSLDNLPVSDDFISDCEREE